MKRKDKAESPFPLRLERDLKTWLEVKAKENKRSLNGELSFVLEKYRQQQGVQHG